MNISDILYHIQKNVRVNLVHWTSYGQFVALWFLKIMLLVYGHFFSSIYHH